MKLGEAMYKAQQAGADAPAGEAGAQAKQDDVIDADFKEVDGDKKKNA
jgi:molecular chaperone DnaK